MKKTSLKPALSPQPSALSNNSALRVLYVTHYSSLGGGANLALLHMILDMRNRYNIIPSVLIPKEGELSECCRENGIEVICSTFYQWQHHTTPIGILKGIVKQTLNLAICRRKVLRLFHGRRFDIVHTNSSVTETGSLIADELKIPHVWHIREFGREDYNVTYFMPKSIVMKYYARAKRLITISHSMYDNYVIQKKIFPPQTTVCIYDGLNVPEEYAKTYMNDGRMNFCMIGAISSGKNIIMALKACEKLKALSDKFTLHIIGEGTNGYPDMLKKYVHDRGLDDCVKFWGFRRDVWDILRAMDVGLMLSKCEGFGRVTVEYMLSYMPVIGVNSGATPEIVADGETGYIVPLDDVEKLSDVMRKFIENPGMLGEMGRKGRERAVKNFAIERNTDEVYSLYREILGL